MVLNGLYQRTWIPLRFPVFAVKSRLFHITERVLPCVFDPANGRAGCSFCDCDKLLRATTHCPLASSHLMSLSSFLIPLTASPNQPAHRLSSAAVADGGGLVCCCLVVAILV